MRGFYLAVVTALLFISLSTTAQDLVNSRRSSYYTFIYKINNAQAEKLYKDIWDVDTTFFSNLFDFYPTDSTYEKELPLGHFVFVKTLEGSLHCELHSTNNLNMNLLNNHRDLVMVFSDLQGNELHDVNVKVRSRKIPFRNNVKAYRLGKSNKRGIVSAEYQGHVSYFEIDRQYNNTFFVRTGRKIIGSFPMNHILSPILYIKSNVQRIIWGDRLAAPGIYHRIARLFKAKPVSGYIVFNKPKFKPYDTLRLKGVLTTKKGKPVSKEVSVYLSRYYPNYFEKKIATIKPFRKGAYQFELPLGDSLNLRLDDTYSIEFRDKKSNKLLSSNFRYEEYELKNNYYSVRSEQKTKLKPATLYLKGEDSNEMPLFDARAEILLKPKQVDQYYQSKVFVPDTLWFYKTTLDAIGETKVSIPDSVMPAVSLSYEAVITFYNTENERTVKTLSLNHNTKPFPISITIENDSVKVSMLDPQAPPIGSVTMYRSDPSDNSIDKQITLPYSEKVNPFADWYSVQCTIDGELKTEGIQPETLPDKVQVLSHRTADSLTIVSENPRGLLLHYFLFRNKSLIECSQTESLNVRMKAKPSDAYTLSVQYVWAGISQTREYYIDFDKKNLDISLDHPAIIYPGQKASFKITVRDAFGEPVENADITAYALTKKFEGYSAPTLPSFSKAKAGRAIFNEFRRGEFDHDVSRSLDWSYWKKTLGLDSIAFYKFLYPVTGYYEHRIKAEARQFAPFVVRNGDILPVQVIYVDDQPVYYQGVSTLEPYSFHIYPGAHKIDIRLNNTLITIRDVEVGTDQKLIFSIDRNHLPSNCTASKMPFRFSDDELKKLSRYFLIVRSNTQLSEAYLQQGNTFRVIGNKHRLISNGRYGYTYEQLAGPFYPGPMTYKQREAFQLSFDYEPFFSYEFKEKILKMRDVNMVNRLKNSFSWYMPPPSFEDRVLSLSSIQKLWEQVDEVIPPFKRFPDFEPVTKRVGRLTLVGAPKEANDLAVKATFIVDLNNPDNYFILTSEVNNTPFYPGNYQAVVIFGNEQYIKADSVEVKPYGENHYNLDSLKLHQADAFSAEVLNTLKKWSSDDVYMMKTRQKELQKVRELFYEESSANYSFDHVVTGRIVSAEDGEPIAGVNVLVKGTAIGTVTDMDGRYRLNCPANGTLVFSFIGLQSQEALIASKDNISVELVADVTQLNEVVFTGFGVRGERKSLSYAVSTQLQGRVAGVPIRSPRYRHESMEDTLDVVIRGYAGAVAASEPLVILDGVIVRLNDIDKSRVTAMEVMNGPEAIALFGSRAAGGVILLSTKPGTTKAQLKEFSKSVITVAALENVPGNALRKNFRDYAFWKPTLTTDHGGHAEFEATFPDDVTGWNAYVLGMAKKRSGQTVSTIKSYKPLLAQIAQPHFLIEGDSSTAIGKITNYAQEEIELDRTIKIDDKEIGRSLLKVKDSKIDSIHLAAQGTDSLAVFYSVTYKDYTDGELRKIPVLPKGVKETQGYFIALTGDTTITLNFDNSLGKTKLYAQADLLDVLLDEIKSLIDYPYECNEQLASKLWALLLEKKIKVYKNEKFKNEREIHKAIKKLVAHQHDDGSWSWWGTDGGNAWITLHVARCLDLAQKEGYAVAINKQSLINYLEINMANLSSKNRLDVQVYLMEQGEKLQVRELADSIQKSKTSTVHDKLTIQRLKQLSGETPDWNWINAHKSQTIKGNSYWGEERTDLFDNAVINTLLVYKIMEKQNPSNKELIKIRNYFLEHRKRNWRNTYESSQILQTILPGILEEKHTSSEPKLQLTGLVTQQVVKFPFEQTVTGSGAITVSKSGQAPVYFTAYQETWNTNPSRSEKDFTVTTSFEDAPAKLKSGKPVDLVVKVEVKNDAEYVMIEVPIPAGCSYASKPQTRANGEVHREYYNHKTNIYCQYLKKGTYSYTIPLLPRYSGSYALNPALVECMYFPVLYGREGMKKVTVD